MINERRKESVKFATLQGLFWLACAIGGFLNVFMLENGFTASEVGLVNAIASAVGILATPICGMVCDKIRSVKKVTLTLYIVGAIMYAAVPMSAELKWMGISMLMLLVPVMSFFRTPFYTLTDNWLVQNSNQKGLNFGAIRSFGSLLYAVGGIGISFVIPYMGVSPVFMLSSIMFIPVVLIGLTIDDSYQNVSHIQKKEKLQPGKLFRDYYYIIFLIFTFLLGILTTCDTNFLPYMLEAIGEDTAQFGLIGGYRALLEIPVLVFFKYVRKKVSPLSITVAVGVFYAVSAILMGGFSANIWHILIYSSLNGMACGIWIAFASNHIYQMTPEGLKATAQPIFGATSSVAGIVGNLLGGVLIDLVGAKLVYVYLGIMMLTTVGLYIILNIAGKKRALN